MKVGEWVEFDAIVVQQKTAAGSEPAARKLGRTRRGMVMGERTIYEVTNGAPPKLGKRRQVLLVAVTSHRAYLVEKANVRPAKAPRRRVHRVPEGQRLGDLVEFEVAIAKEATADGSRPAPRSLGKVRKGRVVGERSVCEAQRGTPPVLGERQTVLLVAVSMHRRVQVLPSDVRPLPMAAPAKPGKARGKTGAARQAKLIRARSGMGPLVPGVTMSITGGAMGASGRAIVTQADLDVLVADAINRQVAANAIFTAYDVTTDLRGGHPSLDIPHAMVRATVHNHMRPYLASDLYESETASFGASTATRYVPS